MVNAQFGLRDNPFRLTPDLGVRCDWASFAATRQRVEGALREGGKHVLTGEPGVGKTLLLRSLAQELAPLGAAYVVCGRQFATADLERALGAGRPAVLLLDDAHHLDAAALEDLLARDGALALGAIPGFAAKNLDHSVLEPLAAAEIAPYVHCRLAAAGWSGGELFDDTACTRLWSFSQGAPRRINNLCSAALFLASQRQAMRIDGDLIEAAAAGLSLQLAPTPASPPPAPRRRISPVAAVPSGESPTIMAAFMRERAVAATTKPIVQPPKDAPPAPRAPEQPEPAEAATLLRRAEAGRPGRLSMATAEQHRAGEPELVPEPAHRPESAPPPRRRAWPLAPALALIALAGLGVVWSLELAPTPDLRTIDWGPVQAVTSPHVDPATAAGAALAVVAGEKDPQDSAAEPPIVFPYTPAPTPPPIPAPAAASAPAEPAAATASPVASPASPLTPASEPPTPPPPVEASQTDAPPQAAPPASAAPATQVATVSDAPPPSAPAQTVSDEAPEPPSAASENEERIAELLAQARRLALAFALTTPAGQSAYDSYQEVLALEPGRREALAGLDEIAAKYDDLADLARSRENPALVQLYKSRAAQVRRDRARLGAEAAASSSAAR